MLSNKDKAWILKEIASAKLAFSDSNRRVDNYANNRIDDTNDNLSEVQEEVVMTTDTVDFVLGDILPQQDDYINEISEVVDYILTEILPTESEE